MANMIGERLRKQGKSQSWLAKSSGVSLSTVKRLVHNRLPNPRFQHLWAISKSMGVPMGELWDLSVK
jgi:transcriptional regulator with XRE-family HTH domain